MQKTIILNMDYDKIVLYVITVLTITNYFLCLRPSLIGVPEEIWELSFQVVRP